jgi:hypothetical protein
MFKFLKEKLRESVNIFSKKADEEAEVVKTIEKQEEKKK